MSKHEIEIEGLPDGWVPVAYRCPWAGEYYIRNSEVTQTLRDIDDEYLIVKKKQPRRIAFEETDYTNICDLEEGVKWTFFYGKYWREFKETEEPKLCLSVEECEEILGYKNGHENVKNKLLEFLRNNNKTS